MSTSRKFTDTLANEYFELLANLKITRASEVNATAKRLLKTVHRFDAVSEATGVPAVWGAASFEREASSDFRLSPAQGDPWNKVSTHVPRGRGPFQSWEAACIDSYQLDHLDQVGPGNWTMLRACYEGEKFNGWGYRSHGINSPYLWAGTNAYSKGKYVADGKWSAGSVDKQLGIVPVMLKMIELEPGLALTPVATPTAPPQASAPTASPEGLGGDVEEVRHMQHLLNTHQHADLKEDGSYGPLTQAAVRAFQSARGLEVDGIYGPKTKIALENVAVGL